jgi:SAM-dependent methyltransferase
MSRRHGGDPSRRNASLNHLHAVRDRVLAHAMVADGDVLLDVGCGDGLLGFGALSRGGQTIRVIFSDVSQALLEHCRACASEMGVLDRCEFLRAAAEDLAAIARGSVDVVTTRSVMIYVSDKRRAFREFYRVLKAGGRLSIFEPIARFFGYPPAPHLFGWQTFYDVTRRERSADRCDEDARGRGGRSRWPGVDVAAHLRVLRPRRQPPSCQPDRRVSGHPDQPGITTLMDATPSVRLAGRTPPPGDTMPADRWTTC